MLGVLLVIAGGGYLAGSLSALLIPGHSVNVAAFTFIGEALFMLWLLAKGRKRHAEGLGSGFPVRAVTRSSRWRRGATYSSPGQILLAGGAGPGRGYRTSPKAPWAMASSPAVADGGSAAAGLAEHPDHHDGLAFAVRGQIAQGQHSGFGSRP